MTKTPLASDFQGKSRDPQWERELRDWLLQQPEEKRFEFLMELVDYQVTVALQLAHKSLERRESFVKLLEFAVSHCDASTVKYWLDAIVPRLGFRRTVDNLVRLSSHEVKGVSKSLYWLPRYATSEADQIKLTQLIHAVSEKTKQ